MAFKTVTNKGQIGGFWDRTEGSSIMGQVKKFVETDTGGFWLIQTTEGGVPLQGKDEESDGRMSLVGELIAVSGSMGLDCLHQFLNNGVVRLTSHGKKAGKKGKAFWDIDVEHDDSGKPYSGSEVKYNNDGVPF